MDYKTLTVEKLIVKDPSGKGHIELCGHGLGDGPTIRLCDRDNRASAELGIDSYGAMCLTLLDAHHQERIKLSVLGGGGACLGIFDANGTERVSLGFEPGNNTFLCLSDPNGATRISLDIDEDDNDPSLSLMDRNGTSRVQATEDYKDDYLICTHGADGEQTWRTPAAGARESKG